MTNFLAGVDELVDELKTLEHAGKPLRVVTRLEDVNPPCVWVAVESIDHHSAGGELTVRLFLLATAVDEYRGIKALSPLLDEVLTVVSPTEETTVQGVAPTFQQKALPALRVTTTVLI